LAVTRAGFDGSLLARAQAHLGKCNSCPCSLGFSSFPQFKMADFDWQGTIAAVTKVSPLG